MDKKDESFIRYSRTKVSATCLMIHQGRSYMMDVSNISASGILLNALEDNSHEELAIGSRCVLEIVVNDNFNFNVEAEVIRFQERKIALRYTEIPEDKQVALWQLLGEHVHLIETVDA